MEHRAVKNLDHKTARQTGSTVKEDLREVSDDTVMRLRCWFQSCCCYQTTPAVKSQANLDLAAGGGVDRGGGVIIDGIELPRHLFKMDPEE